MRGNFIHWRRLGLQGGKHRPWLYEPTLLTKLMLLAIEHTFGEGGWLSFGRRRAGSRLGGGSSLE